MATGWQKRAIALTGALGAGKTTVSEIFRSLGAFVVSADDLAREAVMVGGEALQKIRQAFGDRFIDPTGNLKRRELATLVFSDAEARKKLEEIVHPIVATLAQKKFEEAAKTKFALHVYECPLLFEAGIDREGFKKIVFVNAPIETCLERFQSRTGLSKAEALQRLNTQMPVEEKIKRADFVIENNGTLEELKRKSAELFKTLTL